MIIMQKLSKEFEKAHPDIKLDWVVLEENVLRERVTTDIATRGGSFDVMTIGTYETPIWAKKAWLIRLDDDLPPATTWTTSSSRSGPGSHTTARASRFPSTA